MFLSDLINCWAFETNVRLTSGESHFMCLWFERIFFFCNVLLCLSSGLASDREETEEQPRSVTVPGASAQRRKPRASDPHTMHSFKRR